jgi:CubicO group peptidase (beta-lactamase class C family)
MTQRTTNTALVLTGLLVVAACGTDIPVEYGAAAAIDSVVNAALESGPLAGASVAIAQSGEVVYVGSYGLADIAAGTSVTPLTRFNAASVGKMIAAAGVMRLVDDRRVRLTDRVADLLPELQDVETLRGVQLRHLLSMTSGLPDYVQADLGRWEATHAPLEPAFVLEQVRSQPRAFAPGTEWMYSNTGFYLAGLVVEEVTGSTWGEFITTNVLPALGLSQTGLCDAMGRERSVGYEVADSSFILSVQDQETGIRGDAGLCATTSDLALLPSRLKAGALSSDALESMVSSTRLDDGTEIDYGHGVARGRLFGRELWGHLGGAGSIVAALVHFEAADVSIAVAVNTREASLGALVLMGDVARAVLSPEDAPLPELPPEDDVLSQLAGRYVGDRDRTAYSVLVESDTLFRARPGVPTARLPLLWRGDLEFGRADWPLDRFRFHMVAGRVTGFSTYYNGVFDGFYARRD